MVITMWVLDQFLQNFHCLNIFLDGNTELIDAVLASSSFDRKSITNEKGETPLHLAVKSHLDQGISYKVLKHLLQAGLINPLARDKLNKRARDHIPRKSKDLYGRIKLLDDAASKFHSKRIHKKVIEKDKCTSVSDISSKSTVSVQPSIASLAVRTKKRELESSVIRYDDMTLLDKINYQLSRIGRQYKNYFQASNSQRERKGGKNGKEGTTSLESRVSTGQKQHGSSRSHDEKSASCALAKPTASSISFGAKELDGLDFDSLPWEVEITRNVIEFFKNTKKHSPRDRISAARVIYSIAEGKRNPHLAKRVGNNSNVCLFEARFTKSGRILWEKSITYSKKISDICSCPIYTEVIRVWEVILDHDDLDSRIDYCSKQIEKSYERGLLSSVQQPLKPRDLKTGVRGKEVCCQPSTYTIKDLGQVANEFHYVPAGSTNESEYNVTTFYSFDTVHVKSMITGSNEKRDYPFKEWQKEHEIIKIEVKEAIFLLGRSGTGKTTCCLYRLWNEFKNYWNPESTTYCFKIPRKTLVFSSSMNDSESEKCDSGLEVSPTSLTSSLSSSVVGTSGADSGIVVEILEEDFLHQMFVTKNYVLCDQMKKRFYCMVAAYDFLQSHLEFEEKSLPNTFSKFEDLSFPVFLTARQFYMILDNSLGGDDTFFKRDADGNLLVKIVSLDYDDEDADILLDMEECDMKDNEANLVSTSPSSEPTAMRQHSDKWTEVTALYFKEFIWPKLSHKSSKELDPMLVWLEIQSFIKGSEVAVKEGAPLNRQQYVDVGYQIAPNFSDHRESIYDLYLQYKKFVQKCRYSNHLFDECDLILDLHKRLKKANDVPWAIHSIYIDEVQDFTQSELKLFIHCCRDPNSMFFTGDTAQSIMRGIAFRFKDLRSFFYDINSKEKYIKVPKKPIELTINYRSHSGILKLAGSVIDLISEFFKDSIDHLPEEEGMFPGPMPVFFQSCKDEELSLLLSANKRECSAIEFGAHQVILVQSKEAKDKLPDTFKGAIVLTIFQSKGLEFDDVLLYNFFTDSLVSPWVSLIIVLCLHLLLICVYIAATIKPTSLSTLTLITFFSLCI